MKENPCSSLRLFQEKLDWSLKKKACKTYHSYMQYVNSIISYKPEDSGNLRRNYRALCIQGWAFKDLLCFQRVAFRNNHSDNVQRIIDSYIQRLIEDYRKLYSENTFGELQRITFTEKHSNNNIQIITFRKTFRITLTDLTFISFSRKKKISSVHTRRYFKTLKGKKTLSKK